MAGTNGCYKTNCDIEPAGACESCGKYGCIEHSRHCSKCDDAHLCLECSDGDFAFCGVCGPDWCIPCIVAVGEEYQKQNPGFDNGMEYPPCPKCGGKLDLA